MIRSFTNIILTAVFLAGVFGAIQLFTEKNKPNQSAGIENKEEQARYTELRAQYMFDMVKDPGTGKIPRNIIDQELSFARMIPEKGKDPNSTARVTTHNNFFPAGPNNQGGRTRAVAYDIRYNGTTNQVILAGGVSGGIQRSNDGGQTWTRVSPDNEIHNITNIVQDPRTGNQDIWYAGGGEPLGNSTSGLFDIT